MKRSLFAALLMCWPLIGRAETPEEGIALGARVHGAFGSFIPLGIKIGLDAVNRLNAKPRELTVLYYDGAASPCACFADGTAIATNASVGQRTLVIALEKAPDVSLAGRSTVFWGPPRPIKRAAAMFGRPITRSGHAQIAVVNCSEKALTPSSHQTQGLTNAG